MAMPIVGNILMQLFRSYNQSCSNFLNSCLESALITLNLQENDEMMFQRCLSKALERADFSLFIELPIALTALTICLEASSAAVTTTGQRVSFKRYDGRSKTFSFLQQIYVTLSDYFLYYLHLDAVKNADMHELTSTAHCIMEEDVHCFRDVYSSMNSCFQWARKLLLFFVCAFADSVIIIITYKIFHNLRYVDTRLLLVQN
ncbi:hypothetical protein D918_08821 [Trichuris suis]|nr:hypothetical protein D918_08821 [Trichuris suis]